MPAVLNFIRALLRLEGNKTPHRAVRAGEGDAFEDRRPLYIGRGIVCLGGQPPEAQKHRRR